MEYSQAQARRRVRLPDRSRIVIRQLGPRDVEALRAFYLELSTQTVFWRFGGGRLPRVSEINRWAHPTRDSVHLIAETPRSLIIGHAMWVRSDTDPTRAEAAFVVADEWQNRGVGSKLFDGLARLALQAEVDRFDALVEAENRRVSSWLDAMGAVRTTTAHGQSEWVIELEHRRS